ncbi:hypothetical protein, partial [Nonomuraea angiospora]
MNGRPEGEDDLGDVIPFSTDDSEQDGPEGPAEREPNDERPRSEPDAAADPDGATAPDAAATGAPGSGPET